MEKINVAELLKDCPKGMELDCTILDKVILDGVNNSNDPVFPIRVRRKDGFLILLTKYGQYFDDDYAKCVIFPKGKTTWEGFVPPCQFKDGDILSYQCAGLRNRTIYIYRHHHTMNTSYYVALGGDLEFMVNHKEGHALSGNNTTARLATKEEKEKLFQAIKDNGYKWNHETKTLEVVQKFKVGDKVKHKCDKNNTVINITGSKQDYYYIQYYNIIKNDYQTEKISFTDQDKYELIIDKFE